VTIGALMEEKPGEACVRCGEPIAFDERGWFELEDKSLKLTSQHELLGGSAGFNRAWHVRCVDPPLRPRGS